MRNGRNLGLLFFGRLDDEKGFGLILDVLQLFVEKYGTLPFSFYVFGKGKYEKDLMDFGQKHPAIHFFGWQPLDKIKKYKDNFDYCLVPSTFLETFGLTALNSLSMGIPVIGYAKGGLAQFIDKENDISQINGIDDKQKLFILIETLLKKYNGNEINFEKEKKHALEIANKYTVDKWFETIEPIIGKPKRILIVSDFKSKLGGIETYIHDVANILNEKGYEVKIFGSEIPNGIYGKLLRYIKLPCVMWNFISWLKLKKQVDKFMPKVIWYNSLIRNIGWYPIKKLSKYESKKIMMYHDLGYFHPYPSLVTQESMVNFDFNLKNFIKSGNTKNPIKIISIFFKYLSVKLLARWLKSSVDIHLVPSKFMEKIIGISLKIDDKKIKILPHFIQ